MRSKLHFLPLALIIATSLRCSDGPTQPTPVALDLNGTWTMNGTNVHGVEVQVRQISRSVTFGLGPTFEFQGTLTQGGLLAGQVVLDSYWRYDLRGTPTPTRIELTGDGYFLRLAR